MIPDFFITGCRMASKTLASAHAHMWLGWCQIPLHCLCPLHRGRRLRPREPTLVSKWTVPVLSEHDGLGKAGCDQAGMACATDDLLAVCVN